jgi:hypothetical protein
LHCPGICCQTELQDGRKEQTEKEKKDSEELQELLKRAEQLKTPPQPEHQVGQKLCGSLLLLLTCFRSNSRQMLKRISHLKELVWMATEGVN